MRAVFVVLGNIFVDRRVSETMNAPKRTFGYSSLLANPKATTQCFIGGPRFRGPLFYLVGLGRLIDEFFCLFQCYGQRWVSVTIALLAWCKCKPAVA
jgi:hypothetical protein